MEKKETKNWKLKAIEDTILLKKLTDEEKPFRKVGGKIIQQTGQTIAGKDWAQVVGMGRGTIVPGCGVVENDIKVGDIVLFTPEAVDYEYRVSVDGVFMTFMLISYPFIRASAEEG